eukprot:TRINITY_DN41825_c0_g1_i1.p1 TRINITY_DN41825_c0_g1~~TRINITY_DN41825_c0_g1_i1.p1  ORF type:complete len:716 (+),score=133.31 TRINITY_DN41825_c0_g1_i1:241-2148(+)
MVQLGKTYQQPNRNFANSHQVRRDLPGIPIASPSPHSAQTRNAQETLAFVANEPRLQSFDLPNMVSQRAEELMAVVGNTLETNGPRLQSSVLPAIVAKSAEELPAVVADPLGASESRLQGVYLPATVAKSAEELTAAVADLPKVSAAEMLMNPGMSKESLASALLQSETAHLAERQLALEVLGQLQSKSDQAMQLEGTVNQLKLALAASEERDTQATSNASYKKFHKNAILTGSSASPSLNQTENATSNSTLEEAAPTTLSGKIDAFLGKIAGWSSSSPEFKALIIVIFCSCVIGCVVGIISVCCTPRKGEEPMRTSKKVIIILCFINPFVFLIGALFIVRQLHAELTQNFAYLGLVMVLMFFQCMMSAGPISEGLVVSCCKLPQVIAKAFVSLEKQVVNAMTSHVNDLIPGDDPLEGIVGLFAEFMLQVFNPAIQTVAGLMDPRLFLPSALFNLAMLAPLLGLFLFVLFLSIWGVLSNLLMLKMGAVTVLVFWLMIALAFLSVTAEYIVQMFIYVMQGIMNFMLRTLLKALVPSKSLDPIVQRLGGSMSATEFKEKIIESLQLDLDLDDEDEEDEDDNAVMDHLNSVFCGLCGCLRSSDEASPEEDTSIFQIPQLPFQMPQMPFQMPQILQGKV